jgi:glycosyltransferase involved in cell wall biosynthesis
MRGGCPVLLDLAENEFERSAVISKKKITNYFTFYKFTPKRIIEKSIGFLKRKYFDRFFYDFVESCDGITVCSRKILFDAEKYNKNIFYVPDSVDFKVYNQKKIHTDKERVVIGWIGMPNSLIYLSLINRPLTDLIKKHDLEIVLITDWKSKKRLLEVADRFSFKFTSIKWELGSIASQLTKLDIGVAPLPADSYKSGNKVLTYWAAGLPVVASPTFEYKSLIIHDRDGLIAYSDAEWYEHLEKLILDAKTRERLGSQGYDKARQEFSIASIAGVWERALEKVVQKKMDISFKDVA